MDIKEKIRMFFINAINSWVTTAGGSIVGISLAWNPLKAMFDGDPATTGSWMGVLAGVGAVFMGFLTRDHTKALVQPK